MGTLLRMRLLRLCGRRLLESCGGDASARRRLGGRELARTEQLLRAERLVVDERRRLDQILQVSTAVFASCQRGRASEATRLHAPGEEVAEVVEVAVLFVLDVDDAPAVLPSAHRLAVNDDVSLGADNGERHHALQVRGRD